MAWLCSRLWAHRRAQIRIEPAQLVEHPVHVVPRSRNPVVLALIDLLKKAMPDCDEETIFWGYHFVSGAMTHNMARTGRLDELSHGLCSSSDFESIRRHMAKFMAAGFHAIVIGQSGSVYIDPYERGNVEYYISFRKAD